MREKERAGEREIHELPAVTSDADSQDDAVKISMTMAGFLGLKSTKPHFDR